MRKIEDMSAEDLAGLVCTTLANAGVTVTLTGGGCAAIWSRGKYTSNDLDFIEEGPVPRRRIREALRTLGFHEEGRHFVHDRAKFFVEFPTGPLMVGAQRVENVAVRKTASGDLRLLSATDCVKDRLAAYFHWNDAQSLDVAVLVARTQAIDMNEVERWAISEGHAAKLRVFAGQMNLRVTEKRKRDAHRRGRA